MGRAPLPVEPATFKSTPETIEFIVSWLKADDWEDKVEEFGGWLSPDHTSLYITDPEKVRVGIAKKVFEKILDAFKLELSFKIEQRFTKDDWYYINLVRYKDFTLKTDRLIDLVRATWRAFRGKVLAETYILATGENEPAYILMPYEGDWLPFLIAPIITDLGKGTRYFNLAEQRFEVFEVPREKLILVARFFDELKERGETDFYAEYDVEYYFKIEHPERVRRVVRPTEAELAEVERIYDEELKKFLKWWVVETASWYNMEKGRLEKMLKEKVKEFDEKFMPKLEDIAGALFRKEITVEETRYKVGIINKEMDDYVMALRENLIKRAIEIATPEFEKLGLKPPTFAMVGEVFDGIVRGEQQTWVKERAIAKFKIPGDAAEVVKKAVEEVRKPVPVPVVAKAHFRYPWPGIVVEKKFIGPIKRCDVIEAPREVLLPLVEKGYAEWKE